MAQRKGSRQKPSHSLARVEVRVLASPVCASSALSLAKRQVEGEPLGVRACYSRLLQGYKAGIANRPYLLTDSWAHDFHNEALFLFIKKKKGPKVGKRIRQLLGNGNQG